MKLNKSTLADIPIDKPSYNRDEIGIGIAHFGVGGFHRAHLALYTDDVAAAGGDWAIRGIGLLETDRRMAQALEPQDHLYTLIERSGDPRSRTWDPGELACKGAASGDCLTPAQVDTVRRVITA